VVNVVVTNTEEQSGTLANGYTYTGSNPAPTVASISPTTGGTTGGTTVTITGTGFLTGATITLGGNSASAVTVVNGQSVTATTSAHAAGAVNVVVNAGERIHLHRAHLRLRPGRARGRFEFGHGQRWADGVLHSVDRRRWVEWHSGFHLRGSAKGRNLHRPDEPAVQCKHADHREYQCGHDRTNHGIAASIRL
jgi:hypothetical protein